MVRADFHFEFVAGDKCFCKDTMIRKPFASSSLVVLLLEKKI